MTCRKMRELIADSEGTLGVYVSVVQPNTVSAGDSVRLV